MLLVNDGELVASLKAQVFFKLKFNVNTHKISTRQTSGGMNTHIFSCNITIITSTKLAEIKNTLLMVINVNFRPPF